MKLVDKLVKNKKLMIILFAIILIIVLSSILAIKIYKDKKIQPVTQPESNVVEENVEEEKVEEKKEVAKEEIKIYNGINSDVFSRTPRQGDISCVKQKSSARSDRPAPTKKLSPRCASRA